MHDDSQRTWEEMRRLRYHRKTWCRRRHRRYVEVIYSRETSFRDSVYCHTSEWPRRGEVDIRQVDSTAIGICELPSSPATFKRIGRQLCARLFLFKTSIGLLCGIQTQRSEFRVQVNLVTLTSSFENVDICSLYASIPSRHSKNLSTEGMLSVLSAGLRKRLHLPQLHWNPE